MKAETIDAIVAAVFDEIERGTLIGAISKDGIRAAVAGAIREETAEPLLYNVTGQWISQVIDDRAKQLADEEEDGRQWLAAVTKLGWQWRGAQK